MDKFEFPNDLPSDIEALRYKNGLNASYEYFNVFIDKVCDFLTSNSLGYKVKQAVKRRDKSILFVSILCVSVLVFFAILGYIVLITYEDVFSDVEYPVIDDYCIPDPYSQNRYYRNGTYYNLSTNQSVMFIGDMGNQLNTCVNGVIISNINLSGMYGTDMICFADKSENDNYIFFTAVENMFLYKTDLLSEAAEFESLFLDYENILYYETFSQLGDYVAIICINYNDLLENAYTVC